MTISILQLNMNADNYWDALTRFLTTNDFDIIQLQEVAGAGTICGNIASKRDCFAELEKLLKDKYKGELAITQRFTSSPTSYFGNATFYKKDFSVLSKQIFYLQKNEDLFDSKSENFEDLGRAILHLTLNVNGKEVSFLNAHGAWGGTNLELPHQTEQLEKAIDYVKTINKPFVLTGDLNISPDQPSIQKLDKLATNLITKYQITNTLNPRLHAAKSVFPKGVAADYIFVSDDLGVKKFEVLSEDLSDHFGLVAVVEL